MKSIISKILILIVWAIVPFSFSFSQGDPSGVKKDTTLLGTRQTEEIAESRKPDFQVPVIVIPVQTGGLTFDTLDIPSKSEFKPAPPRFYPPDKEVWPALYNNFIKVGFGRFATPYGRLYLNNGRNERLDAGLDFSHISASSEYLKFTNFREDSGTVRVASLLGKQTVSAKIHAYNTNYFYFADSIAKQVLENKDTIRQNFTRIAAEIGLLKNFDTSAVRYDVRLIFRDWFDRNKNSDMHFEVLPSFNWMIHPKVEAAMRAALILSNTKFNDTAQVRFFLDLAPTASFKIGKTIRATAGIQVNSYSDTLNQFGVYPIAKIEFDAIKKGLTVYGGVKGGMQYNQYYHLVMENRYIAQVGNLMPTREKINIYLGLNGAFAKWFNYDLRFYTRSVADQLIYFNPEGGSRFNLVYDSLMTERGLDLKFGMNWKEKVRAGLRFQAREFQLNNDSLFNFGVPGLKGEASVSYNFASKLWLTASAFLYGKRTMSIDSLGAPIDQKMVADLNFLADYRFSKRFSVFLECNNILNLTYQRFYGYQVRPFDIKGGLTFSF